MFSVISAWERSSGQWLMGKAWWVLDRTLTKCRLKVWIARSAVLVGTLVVWGYKVVGHGLGRKEIEEGLRLFIIEDLNAKMVTARPKEVISERLGGT
jgi:hypothetical protein